MSTKREPQEGDVHTMPALPPGHPFAHREVGCWCKPYLDSVHGGVGVWVHRQHGEA